MSTFDEATLRRFIFEQAVTWNAGRKDDFFALWRALAPGGLTIEYVAKSTTTGAAAWAALDAMWTAYAHQVQLQPVEVIVNGCDIAVYYRNRWPAPQTLSTGIEVYTVRDGSIHARLFH